VPVKALLSAVVVMLAGAAGAQDLPYHVDPSARDIAPNVAAVPTIRFLTTADFPPFDYKDGSGALVGYNVDLARDICNELKVACTIQSWPWDQATKALADNQGDALIAGLAITPENGEQFDFSSVYLMLPGRFVTPKAQAAGFDPARLSGKTIAVRQGSAHEAFVKRYLGGAQLAEFPTEIDALNAVKAGKANLYFGDGMRASFWLNDNPDCCSFAGAPYFRPGLFGDGMAIAFPAGRDAVRNAVDAALVRLKRNGTMDQLYLRWFPISFY
jgi:polar amino acid transport system substrate-binding protein